LPFLQKVNVKKDIKKPLPIGKRSDVRYSVVFAFILFLALITVTIISRLYFGVNVIFFSRFFSFLFHDFFHIFFTFFTKQKKRKPTSKDADFLNYFM